MIDSRSYPNVIFPVMRECTWHMLMATIYTFACLHLTHLTAFPMVIRKKILVLYMDF